MPLIFRPETKRKLLEALTTLYSNAQVLGGLWIALPAQPRPNDLDIIAGPKSDVFGQLKKYIGDNPIFTFAQSEINRDFEETQDTTRESIPLTEYPEFEDSALIASNILSSLETLPWSYQLAVRLPRPLGNLITNEIGKFDISPQHRIVPGTELKDNFPHITPSASLRLAGLQKGFSGWNTQDAYLTIEMSGYLATDTLTEPFLAARDDALSFIGLAVAFDLLTTEGYRLLWEQDRGDPLYVLHQKKYEKWTHVKSIELDHSHKTKISSLTLADDNESGQTAREKLNKISSIFTSEHGTNVKLASKWLFDSHSSEDALLSYVQAAVAIEILLGEENKAQDVGLTKLMANRCAFLIGKTPAARSNLLKIFPEIYDIRSKIVHRGKSRLSAKERSLFHALQEICTLVIRAEQELIAHDQKKAH